MAHIKCRYESYSCILGNEFCYPNCFDILDAECRNAVGDTTRVINPPCSNVKTDIAEFERDCKSYSYEEYTYGYLDFGTLKIGRTEIENYRITYLEIDGRVLKGVKDDKS